MITGLSSASDLLLDSPSTINAWLLAVALPAEEECSASQCVFDDDALEHLHDRFGRSVNLSPYGNTLAIGSLGNIGRSMIILDT
jgi:hypothetical protein